MKNYIINHLSENRRLKIKLSDGETKSFHAVVSKHVKNPELIELNDGTYNYLINLNHVAWVATYKQ